MAWHLLYSVEDDLTNLTGKTYIIRGKLRGGRRRGFCYVRIVAFLTDGYMGMKHGGPDDEEPGCLIRRTHMSHPPQQAASPTLHQHDWSYPHRIYWLSELSLSLRLLVCSFGPTGQWFSLACCIKSRICLKDQLHSDIQANVTTISFIEVPAVVRLSLLRLICDIDIKDNESPRAGQTEGTRRFRK